MMISVFLSVFLAIVFICMRFRRDFFFLDPGGICFGM